MESLSCRPTSARKSWRERVRHFTPAWFTVVMGTGIMSSVAYNFPYGTGGTVLRVFFLFFFGLSFVLFLVISGVTISRYLLFPRVWNIMLVHPVQSMFLGAFPMGSATVINSALIANQDLGLKWGGTAFLHVLWGLWWLDVFVSFVIALGLIYVMTTRQTHSIDKMTTAWLFPVVTLIVASSTGGNLASALRQHDKTMALLTSAFSLAILTMGLSLALMILTIYLLRLILHGPPQPALVLSAVVALGPLGQGGYSVLVNGQDMSTLFPTHVPQLTGQSVFAVCFCLAFIMWAMGLSWTMIALLSIYARAGNKHNRGRVPFNIGYWGLIFPNGVYAMLSLQLGKVLDSPFFRVFGAVWSVLTFVLWFVTMAQTVPAIINGSIFEAPCLAETQKIAHVPMGNVTERENHQGTSNGCRPPSLMDGRQARDMV